MRDIGADFYDNITLLNSLLPIEPGKSGQIVDVALGYMHTLVQTTS
jgi:hypothetical protein